MEYCDDLGLLLDIIEGACLPVPKDSVIYQYRKGRRIRDSNAYALTVDNLSTIASKGCYDMSSFDISSLHGDSKVAVTVVKLEDRKLRNTVADKLFGGSVYALRRAMIGLVQTLNQLRSHFIFLRERNFGYTEPGYFQPIFTLFLDGTKTKVVSWPDFFASASEPTKPCID